MSSNLIWEPVDWARDSLPTALKFALRSRFGQPINRDFDEHDIDYLEGLRDGGCAGAEDLLAAIDKHGVVNVREVY